MRTVPAPCALLLSVACLVSCADGGGAPIVGEGESPVVQTDEALTAPTHAAFASNFDGLGTPYGGCGVPQGALGTSNFVALNVQNTPHDYSQGLPRPVMNGEKRGEFDNGRNCGRWVRVTIGDNCTKNNSGKPGVKICEGGAVADGANGATLDLLVADSCQDNNAWCRDDRYHLDLSRASLGHFRKNGRNVGDLAATWGNRKISWNYVAAPSYRGDVEVGFGQGADPRYYLNVIVTNLPNGIRGVDRLVNGAWVAATMVGDLGQAYQLPNGPTPYEIRVRDADGKLVFGGRQYTFGFPASCGAKCTSAYTHAAVSVHP